MLITKVCPVCNKKFTAKRSSAIYCSRKCLNKYRLKHPKPPTPEFKICPNCGKEFKPSATHFQKYCCHECRIQYNEVRKKELFKSVVRTMVKCPICGKNFKPHRSNAKYCSKACRQAANKKRSAARQRIYYHKLNPALPKLIECIECGKQFKPKSIRNICCSIQCSHKRCKRRENERNRQSYLLMHDKPGKTQYNNKCQICGKYFITTSASAKYCSKECKNIARDDPWLASQKPTDIERFKLPSVIKKTCKHCGKTFTGHIYGNNPFCSGKCELAYYASRRNKFENSISLNNYNALISQGVNSAPPPTWLMNKNQWLKSVSIVARSLRVVAQSKFSVVKNAETNITA